MPSPSSSRAVSTSTAPVAVIGDAYIDEVLDGRGKVSSQHIGGSGLSVATYLALLGVPAVLVASIGDDEAAERVRAHLDEHGVGFAPTVGDATGLVRSTHASGRTSSRFDDAARLRRIAFDDEQLSAIAAARYVAVAGFAFDDKKQQRKLLAAVRQPQNRLVLDPNPREGLLVDEERFRRHFERHASSALLVHVGASDADLIFRSPIDEVTSDLLDLGAANVLATSGRNGGRWVNRTGIDVSAPIAFAEEPVIDTLGAGDAVLAVAIAALVDDGVPTDAMGARAVLHRAMALAAAAIRRPGPLLEDADEVPVSARRSLPAAYRALDRPPQHFSR